MHFIPLHFSRPPKLSADFRERALTSLHHCLEGLKCVLKEAKLFSSDKSQSNVRNENVQEEQRTEDVKEEAEPQMANSHESIPLPYETLSASSAIGSLQKFNGPQGALIGSVVPNKKPNLTVSFSNVNYNVKSRQRQLSLIIIVLFDAIIWILQIIKPCTATSLQDCCNS